MSSRAQRAATFAVLILTCGLAAAAPVERGVCYAHAWRGVEPAGYGSAASVRTVDHLRRVGVNALSLMPFGYMRTAEDPEIGLMSRAMGETDARLRVEIRAAHARGMRVALKPNIWIRSDEWPGALSWKDDAAFATWFASLRRMAIAYAQLAADEGVDLYLFATELKSATARDPAAFRRLIAELRTIYPARGKRGRLGYAANWDEADHVTFWDALDAIGVDVYAPLSASPAPTDAELLAGAKRNAEALERLAATWRRPIVIAELGYRAAVGAASVPSLWPEHDRAAYDPDLQARCYGAALHALWDRPWLEGLYIWKWFTDGKDEHGPIDYSPAGKPAEAVLQGYFTRPGAPR